MSARLAPVTALPTPETSPSVLQSGLHASPRYQLLTVGEAAVMLGKSEKQLRWMIHQDDAPKSALIGGRRMFRLSDIEAHIDAAFAAADGDAAG